jgi:hypothetical protein
LNKNKSYSSNENSNKIQQIQVFSAFMADFNFHLIDIFSFPSNESSCEQMHRLTLLRIAVNSGRDKARQFSEVITL